MDIAGLRDEIPILDDVIYLNTGAGGPSTVSVTDAVCSAYRLHEEGFVSPGSYEWMEEFLDMSRGELSGFIGGEAEEYAFTSSTTEGINRVASALMNSGVERVVVSNYEHPSGRLPWLRLQEVFGLEVEFIGRDGWVSPDMVRDALNGGGDEAVFMSSVAWSTGARFPIEDISGVCDEMDAVFIVDAVQSVGQEDIDVERWGIDVLVGAGHKWLLGPFGAGFIYIDSGVVRDLEPVEVGYSGVEDPFSDEVVLSGDASRFEVGSRGVGSIAGLLESIEIFRGIGMDVIRDEIEGLRRYFLDGVDGDLVVYPGRVDSGLVSLDLDSPGEVVDYLNSNGFVVREVPSMNALRVSIHVFNTESEIDELIECLESGGYI